MEPLAPLAERARSGDRSALEALLLRSAGLAHAVARARLGDSLAADAAAADALARVALRIRTLRDAQAYPHWLYRITLRCVADTAPEPCPPIRERPDPRPVPVETLVAAEHLPRAQHRFVFRVEESLRGDVVGDRSPVRELIVGLGFLQDLGIQLVGAPGEWSVRREQRVVKVAAQKATLDLVVEGTTLRVEVEPESLCPIMLPENAAYPRWEIPGTAIYEGLDHKWRSYRRYSLRVQNEALGIDGLYEACGAKYEGAIAGGNIVAVRLGNHVFHALHEDPAVCAQREGRPLIVLHLKDADIEDHHCKFEWVEFGGYSQYFVPAAKRSESRRYDKEGKLAAALVLPVLDPGTIRKFLR